MTWNRREFLSTTLTAAAGACLAPNALGASDGLLFKVSLAQWSLHRSCFAVDPATYGWEKFAKTMLSDDYRTLVTGSKIDPLRFPQVARQEFGIDAVEYVNTFYFDRARDEKYLGELKKVADGEGVKSLLIMVDMAGDLGNPDAEKRQAAALNHVQWLEAAKLLGCHSIRVNARSDGSLSADEQKVHAVDGLRQLCELAGPFDLNVLVENHGGLSSDGAWLSQVVNEVDHPLIGTLPDFGNFTVTPEREYDRYKGVRQLMPFARAVSAKSKEFDADGNETTIDYARMMKIVLSSGYRGYVGIEYEGSTLSEFDGIRATHKLLLRAGKDVMAADGRG